MGEGNDCLVPGGRLSTFWQVWEARKAHPRVVTILKEGYCLNFRLKPPLTKIPLIKSKYLNREKQQFLIKAVYQMIEKRAITPVQKVTSLGFYSRLFLVPKPGKRWRPVIDLSVVNSFLHVPTFKTETAKNIRDSLQEGEWVTSLDLTDAYFHIPIHPRFQKYLHFNVGDRSYQFTALSFGIATAPLEFTMVAKEVKLMALAEGIRIHQYIDDWLMRAKTKQQCQENTHRLIRLVQSLGWIINFEKSDLIPTQEIEFLGYKFDLRVGLVFPTQKKIDRLLEKIVSMLKATQTSPRELMSLIGSMASMEKTVPLGRLHMRPLQWYLKTHWRYPQSLDIPVPVSQVLKQHLQWWTNLSNLMRGSPLHQKECNLLLFTDASLKGWGGSFRASHSQWSVESGGVKTSHKHSRAKSSISSFKIIRKSASESKSADFHRQLFSGCLSEQTGRHPFSRNVCPNLENHGLDKCQGDPDSGKTHSRESQCLGRFSVKKRQGDSDRMGFESSSVQSNLPLLASTNGRFVCNKVESQATNVCVSCPRRSGLGNRCIEHLLGGSGRLCVLSSGSHTAGDSKDDHLQVQDNHDCPRVARDVLVLGSGGSVHETPSKASFVGESVDSTVQQQTSQQSGLFEPSCLASGVSPEGSRGFSEEVAKRIKEPQRHSLRRIYESRWSIFGKWCQESQVDISDPTIPNIANFLNYLFKEKALKPSTIAGYRTAIADGLGLKGEDVSKSLELNRLLSSFYRDKPVVNRSIPSWDLALVLQALTKRPFEPLGKASLKLLTFKTVFLLTLASGKRRGEIHAWTFSSLSYKENWSQVTIAPSTAFLAKNQLASDGPTVIKPVFIPALKPHLDSSLTQDRSLCPVRALKYYLDRTKELRKNKNLLFVAIKEGFTRDISRATISSWLKQTILLAYEESDSETQQLCQVKAHDVRSMAASLAFKGGVSLSEIVEACFWKSHNTFTNFYLKDLCWHNGQILKLGPIVSAQHVINL